MGALEQRLVNEGIEKIIAGKPKRELNWSYYQGIHPDLPFAPAGATEEYYELRKQAQLPLIRLAVRTACQRLKAEGVHARGERGADSKEADDRLWKIWQANRLDSQQRLPYIHSMVYPRGYVSVWPGPPGPDSVPMIRVEHPDFVWMEFDPRDPMRELWTVKRYIERRVDNQGREERIERAFLYDDAFVYPMSRGRNREWIEHERITNPMGMNPMTAFCIDPDGMGGEVAWIESLIPQQKGIDTMRFFTLLAAQFAAHRQRIAAGYDPVVRDADGNILYQKDKDGNPILDPQTQLPMPIISSPGRIGVDRLLAFPSADTKIFDLPESDLNNYVNVVDNLIGGFSATAQVPPQYLVSKFDNVGADLVTATEATLISLLSDLKLAHGESWERVNMKVARAIGDPELVDESSEMDWADATPIGLQQIGDFASKVVPYGFPMEAIVGMLPGATQQAVNRIGLKEPIAKEPAAAAAAAAATATPNGTRGATPRTGATPTL